MTQLFQDNLHSTLIPTKVASDISGYNADYLARLCREKKIEGSQVGRSWLINRASLETFVKEQGDRKRVRAEELRSAREKEYRKAQKPILKAALTKASAASQVVVDQMARSRTRAHAFAKRSLTPSPRKAQHAYSPRLAALAVSLAVVTGSAFASVDPHVRTFLSAAPDAAVRFAFASQTSLVPASSFRITERTDDAPDFAAALPTVPDAHATSRSFALLTSTSGMATIASVHMLADNARTPFAGSRVDEVATARIASASNAAHDPLGTLIRAYVTTGQSLYDANTAIEHAYLSSVTHAGGATLTLAATARDGVVAAPRVSAAILNAYTDGVYAWNDAAPKVAGTAVLALYDAGDAISSNVAAVPALAIASQDSLNAHVADRVDSLGRSAATGLARAGTSANTSGNAVIPNDATSAEAQAASPALASVTQPISNVYASAVNAAGAVLSLPVRTENTMLGVAGYASSLLDGSELPPVNSAPQVAQAGPTSSSTPSLAAVPAPLPASASGTALAVNGTQTASVISFLPTSWQNALSRFFANTSTLAGAFITSGFHSLLSLLPGGNIMTPTLTVLHVGPTETLALPVPTNLSRGGGLAYVGGTRTTVSTVINNYYPQGLVGGVFSDAVLAVVRPFVNDSISASLRASRHDNSGGSSSSNTNTGTGVSSDGATLTNVTISSGTASLSTLASSNSSLGTASATSFTSGSTTLGTTTVNGDLNVTGTISGNLNVTSLSSNAAIVAPYFVATDTAATSTFTNVSADSLTFGGSIFTTLLGQGLSNIGGELTVATATFSGSGSNFNADLLDGFDSSYFLANSFSSTSAAYYLAQNAISGYSTTSADYWLTTKTTDNLTQGSTNKYYSDTLARGAFSSTATGLTYTAGTGIFSLTPGYSIPLTASTTDWNTAYLSRITSATYPLQIANNVISLAFGTSTSNTWGGTQTFTNAPVLGSLTGFLKATAGVLSTSLIDLSTDVSSTLSVSHGGTGSTSLTGLLKGNGTGALLTAVDGTDYISPASFGSSFYTYLHATTTDALAQGTTNKYYSDTLARGAFSSTATGLTYNSGTGAFSLTAGYVIPLSASTTEWSSFYATPSSRIAAGTNLSWAGNTLNGPSDSYIHNLFSAASPIAYNSGTGAFSFSTSSVSGSGSGFNADFLDGLDSTFFLANSYSTTSANYWLTTKTTDNLAQGSTNKYYSDTLATANFVSNLAATTSVASIAALPHLSLPLSQTTGILAQGQGGTGIGSYTAGDILYADNGGNLAVLPIGGPGLVLKVQAGLPSWGVDQTVGGGGSDGVFATSTGRIYPLDTSNVLLVGTNATSTANSIFEVNGQEYISTKLGIASTSPSAALSVTGNGMFSGNLWAGGTGTFGNLIDSGLTSDTLAYANGSKQLASVTVTGPLTFSAGTLAIGNAAADGSTKGAASFAANDFDASSGNVSIDYVNGQKATASVPGFLSAADFTTFSGKQAALTFTYPLVNTANTISLAFGTTTANSWSSLQTFNGGISVAGNSTLANATSTSEFTNRLLANTAAFGQTGTTTISSTGALSTPALSIGGLSGVLYGVGGTVNSTATSSIAVSGPLSYSGTFGALVGGTGGTLTIANAAADGSTKGAAAFTAADFNDNGSGLLSLDYANGQKASGSQPGFLAAADFTTFSGKQAALTFTYPLVNIANTISLAFGTSTSNTWGGTQTFTNSPIFSTLGAGTINATAAGTLYSTGTSTPTLASEFTYGGTLGQFIGGASGALSLTTNGTALTKLVQVGANTILGNPTGATGNVTAFATSSLGIALSDTTGTLSVPRGGTGQVSFTAGTLIYGSGAGALQSVATSSIAVSGPLSYSGTFGALVGGTGGTLTIANAAADGTTKGAASFAANDFDASAGNVSLDYTNGQKASGSQPGFLAAADFTTFSGKENVLTFTYPLVRSTNTISLAFGTTTSNVWGGLQSFANASSSLFSNTSIAYFGGTSTTTISANGSITLPTAATLTIGNLSGILKATSGVVSVAAAGTDYAPATVGNSILYGNGSGGFSNASVSSPLTFSAGALGIQVANTSQPGYLTSADWNTFNGKENALTFTYPLTRSTNTISLAFGTTTSNTWAGTQTFTNAPVLSSLSGLLQGNGASAVTAVAGTAGQFPYFNGTNTVLATSTLFLTANGNVGVGTTSPYTGYKFAVNGNTITHTGTDQNISVTGTAISALTDIGNETTLTLAGGTVSVSALAGISLTTALGNITYTSGSTGQVFNTDAGEAIRIKGSTGGTPNYVGIGTTTPSQVLSVQGSELLSGNLSTAGLTATGTVAFTGLGTGLVKSTSGTLSIATAGTDYAGPTSGSSLLYGNGSGGFSNASVSSPLTFSAGALGIQVANTSQPGYLTSTDWNTFNNKVSTTRAINTTYPLQGGGDLSADRTLTLAFGTTTSNTWAGTQTFTNSPIFSTLGAGTINATSAGTLYSTGTSTPALSAEFAYSGTLGQFIGGASGTLSITSNGVALTKLAQIAANTILGNPTGATGNVQAFATSSLGIALSDTTGTLTVPHGGTGNTSFTAGNLIYGAGAGDLRSVATSSIAVSGPLSYSGTFGALVGGTGGTISIANAAANGSTKGAASFSVNDFDDDGLGQIFIDYSNGQKASGSQPGFLSSANWTTFNGKENALTFTYPLSRSTNTISLAFGTTTANSWSQLQQFNGNASTTQLTVTGNTYLATTGGNVGIGTTSPWGQLSINPNGISGPAFVVGSSTGTSLTVTNGGSVIIGNQASTNYKLDVAGVSHFGGDMTLEEFNTNNYAPSSGSTDAPFIPSFNITDTNNSDTSGTMIAFSPRNASFTYQGAFIGATAEATGYSASLFFAQSTGASSYAERARFGPTGNFGIGTTSPGSLLSLNGIANFTTATSTFYSTGGINLAAGCFAVNGTCLTSGPSTVGSSLLYGNGSGGFSNASISSPLTFSAGALGIQVANTSQPGYLTSTDWNTFNGKQAALTFTYPLVNTTNTISLAFGTTTANSWSQLQQFNGNASTTALTVSGSLFAAQSAGSYAVFGTSTPVTLQNPATITANNRTWPVTNYDIAASGITGTIVGATQEDGNGSSGYNIAGVEGYASSTANIYSLVAAGIAGVSRGVVGTPSFGGAIGAAVYANQLNPFSANTLNYAVYALGGVNYFQNSVGIGTTSPYAQLALGGGNLVLGAATAGGTPGDLFLPKLGAASGKFLAVDATGKVIATTTPTGAITSVSNADGTLTISPTTGAVVASLNLAHANTWGGVQTFSSAPIFTGLSGLLQGNGASAVTAVAGTAGQFPYFNGTNTVLATSTLFLASNSYVGVGTTTPKAPFHVDNNNVTYQAIFSGGSYLGNPTPGSGAVQFGIDAAQTATIQNFDANDNYFSIANTGGRFILSNSNSGISSITLSGGNINLSATKVGIGTSTPGSLLSLNGIANFGTATSTFYSTGGLNLTGGGCYAINGTCVGGASYTGTYPVQISGSVISLAFGTTTSNTWAGTQTFTNAPVLSSLSGLLQGNGASAVTAVAGTAGQFPYFNGTNTVLATSTLFLATTGNVGIGTTSPYGGYKLAVNGAEIIHTGTDLNLALNGGSVGSITDAGSLAALTLSGGTATINSSGTLALNSIAGQIQYTSGSSGHVFSTSAGEAFRINGTLGGVNNSIGVSSSTPYGLFSINPNNIGTNPSFVIGSSTATNFIVDSGGGVGINTGITSGSSKLIVNSSAVIGGTSNVQSSTLYVNGNGWFNTGLIVNSPFSANATPLTVLNGISPSTANVQTNLAFNATNQAFGLITYSSISSFVIATSTGAESGDLAFNTKLAGTLSEKLRITAAGNVGIGTTSPGSLLSLNGIANFTTATSTFYSTGGLNLTGGGCFAINGTCVGGSSFSNTLANGGTATTTFYNGGVVFSDGTKLTQSAAVANFFWDETNKRLGIGTSTPFAALSVAGTLAANAIIPNGPYTTNLSAFDLGSTNARWNALWAGTLNIGTSTFSIKSDSASNLGFYTAASGGGSEVFTIARSGQIGAFGTPTNDYGFSIVGSTGNNFSRALNVTQADNASEDSVAGYFTQTATPPTVSGGNATITGIYNSVSPGAVTVSNIGTLSINGMTNSVNDTGSVSFGTNGAVGNFANVVGDNVTLSLSPVYGSTATAKDSYEATGLSSSLIGNPTLINVPTGSTYNTYGAQLVNAVSLVASNANLTANAYGLYSLSNGDLTTTGTTAHIGGFYDVSGTADNNYGVQINSVVSGTNNYGLYIGTVASAATNYAIYSNAAAQSYIAGNLGIGSTTPWAQFSINPNGITGPAFAIGSSTGTKFVVTNGGNVGIGTTSPYTKFDVVNGGNELVFNDTLNTSANYLTLKATSGTNGQAGLNLKIDNSNLWQLLVDNNAANSQNSFFIQNGNNPGTRYLTVMTGGNVGIGTTTPTAILQTYVTGIGNKTGFSLSRATTATNDKLSIVFNAADIGDQAAIDAQALSTSNSDLAFRVRSSNTLTESLRITSSGNVGIGTTTPLSKLAVSGGVTIGANYNVAAPTNGLSVQGKVTIGTSTPQLGYALSIQGSGEYITDGGGDAIGLNSNGSLYLVSNGGVNSLNIYDDGATEIEASDDLHLISDTGNVILGGGLYIDNSGVTHASENLVVEDGGTPVITLDAPDGEIDFAADSFGRYFGGIENVQNINDVIFASSSGRIGIATSSPWRVFSVVGSVAINGLAASGGTQTVCINNTTKEIVTNNGACTTSDQRLKKDITPLDAASGLAAINALKPVSFNYKDDSFGKGEQLGFLAQDVAQIFPELVGTSSPTKYTPDVTYTLNYEGLISPMVQAIQALSGRTDVLSLATTSLATQLNTLSKSFSAFAAGSSTPQALTATIVTADSLRIMNDASAARYIVPQTSSTFTFGSSTLSMNVPSEALVSGGNVDLYKLAGYATAGVDALAARTDLLAVKLDDLATRVAALEAMGAATTTSATSDAQGAAGLALATIEDALKGLGIVIHKGYLAVDSLVTHQLVLVKGDDGTSSTGSEVIPEGSTELNVTNALVHPSSKIFLTFTSSVDGSWYISKKQEGSFTITLAKPQPVDTEFDYFLIQTDPNAQVAAVGAPPGSTEAPPAPNPVSVDGGPVVSLNGSAAVQLAQGAAWNDPGAHATAADGTDLTNSISVSGSVDTNTAGLYTVTYRATDSAGKEGEASRIVTVLAPTSAPSDGGTVTQAPPSTPDSGSGSASAPSGDSGGTVSAVPDTSPAS